MKRKLLTVSLGVVPVLFCQINATNAGEKNESGRIIRVVHVHGDATMLASLAGHNSGATVEGSDQLRAVVIKGGSSDVAAVERTIQQLDAESPATSETKNIELVVYLLGGSMEAMAGVPETNGDALTPVLKQLRAVFPYKHYQTLSTMLLRSGPSSKAASSGMMKTVRSAESNGEFLPPSTYIVEYDSARVSAETSPIIHLRKFKFEARIPAISSILKSKDGANTSTQYQQFTVGTESDVDLREGQRVVVANANLGSAEVSFFLVLTAHLVP